MRYWLGAASIILTVLSAANAAELPSAVRSREKALAEKVREAGARLNPESMQAVSAALGELQSQVVRSGVEREFPDACLNAIQMAAWDLSQKAGVLPADFTRFQESLARCGALKDEFAKIRGADDYAALLSDAHNRIADLDASIGKRKTDCAPGFEPDRMLAQVAAGRYNAGELAAMRPALSPLIMQNYMLDAYARRDPNRCELLDKVEERFTEGWGCRDIYSSLDIAAGYIQRSPDLLQRCLSLIKIKEPTYTEADARAVCGVIAKDAGRPEDICAQLTPRYLSGYKLATCVSEWKQLSAETEDDCAAAAPGRPSWYHRCQEYARFKTAYRAKDASLCQGGEVCLALMGRWQGEIAKRYAEKIEAGFCGSMDSYARAEKERVVALLAQLQSYLDSGAVSPEQKPEKASELAALRVRLEGLTAAR